MNRVVPGILLAAGWLLLLIFGSFQMFWGVLLMIAFIGAREYCSMALPDLLFEADRVLLPLLIILPVICSIYSPINDASVSSGLLLGFAGLALYVLYHYRRFDAPLFIMSRTMLGLVYIGFLAAHLVLIRGLEEGAFWLIILTAVTAGSDTGAYIVGSKWGRRKLCPSISPNKTVEGALGGIAGGVLAGVGLFFLFAVSAPLWFVTLLAAGLAVVGMLGDLIESIIKRGFRVKDSGTLLGGHGGVLDRIDSLLLAGPVLYYILIFSGF